MGGTELKQGEGVLVAVALPVHCFFMTPGRVWWSFPSLALKYPRMMCFCGDLALTMVVSWSSQNLSSTSVTEAV